MTMIAGVSWRRSGFGLLAWDSRHKLFRADGSTEFDDTGQPSVLASFPGGWIAGGGNFDVSMRGLAVVEQSPGGTLEELAELLAPELAIACAAAADHPGADPAKATRLAILTAGSGDLEAGIFNPANGLERVPPGARFYIPSGDADGARVAELWRSVEADTWEPESGYAVIRSVARFFAGAARHTPALSGFFRAGIVQRRGPGAPWEMARLEGDAAGIAAMSDAELTNTIRSEVPA